MSDYRVTVETAVYTEQFLAAMRNMAVRMAKIKVGFAALGRTLSLTTARQEKCSLKAIKRAERRYQVAKRRDRARAWRNR